jgi:hypothetical protein
VEASLAGELDEQLAAAVTRMREGPELPEPAELPEPTATQSSLPPVVDEGTEPMMPGGATEPIQVSTLRLVMPRRPLQLLEQTAPMPPAPRNVRKARKATPRPAPSRPTLTGSLRAAMLLALVAAGLAVGMGMGDAPTARQSTTQSR